MRELLQVHHGLARIVPLHIIDCDAQPFVPDGWTVEEHRKGGELEWEAWQIRRDIKLYLNDGQAEGMEGNELRNRLANQPVLNANFLDYLLAHSHLIPEEWKRKAVFFWGTVYRRRDGDRCVRCLFWSGDGWGWAWCWLGSGWFGRSPAAVLAR